MRRCKNISIRQVTKDKINKLYIKHLSTVANLKKYVEINEISLEIQLPSN